MNQSLTNDLATKVRIDNCHITYDTIALATPSGILQMVNATPNKNQKLAASQGLKKRAIKASYCNAMSSVQLHGQRNL